MDIMQSGKQLSRLVKKYRYAIIVVLIGIVLMWLPEQFSSDEEMEYIAADLEQSQQDTASCLAEILAQIDGVGKVKVMLTVAAGESILYQTDEDASDTIIRKETVIITDSDRAQQALIVQILPEEYRGAIVVCQGGDKASVKLAIMDAVSKVTGLPPESISVLKMK